jgi:hypothetical protein
MKLAYWIHGKTASGKTELARRIAGPDAVVTHIGYTAAATTRMMQGAKAVIFEEFREDRTPDMGLITNAFNGYTITKGVLGGTEAKRVKLDVEVMVVISEFPPEDEAIRSRFHVVKIKAPSRENAVD